MTRLPRGWSSPPWTCHCEGINAHHETHCLQCADERNDEPNDAQIERDYLDRTYP